MTKNDWNLVKYLPGTNHVKILPGMVLSFIQPCTTGPLVQAGRGNRDLARGATSAVATFQNCD